MNVKKEIEVSKELDDCLVLVNELVKTIKAKGDYSGLVDELINAVSGCDQIDEEYKANPEVFTATASLRVNELVHSLIAKK